MICPKCDNPIEEFDRTFVRRGDPTVKRHFHCPIVSRRNAIDYIDGWVSAGWSEFLVGATEQAQEDKDYETAKAVLGMSDDESA